MKQSEQDNIWESYILNEDRDQGRMNVPAGTSGKPWGDETPVLEGVNCSCKSCVHWVVGDLCSAQAISLSKMPHDDYGAVVVCETYKAGDKHEG